jgi:hypothetical protein
MMHAPYMAHKHTSSLARLATQVPCWLLYTGVHVNASDPSGVSPLVPGLQTRVVDFGGFGGMTGLNEYTLPALAAVGYEQGRTLFGAPYDWRVPASAQPQVTLSRYTAGCFLTIALGNRVIRAIRA